MVENKMPRDIFELLEKSVNEKIENFEVKQHEGNKKGEGFLGDLLFISLKNKTSKEDHHFVIKQVLPSNHETNKNWMSASYLNEIYMYMKIIPTFQEFQKNYQNIKIFDNVPKCYAALSEKCNEKILLENIKFKNYVLHPKKQLINSKMYEKIFQLYGKFHAISFAFKQQRPELFSELVSNLKNNWPAFTTLILYKSITNAVNRIKRILESRNEEKLLKRFLNYMDNGLDIFKNSIQYKDSYGVIIHGDCWSNNLMFKYNSAREIEDIKLIDFQMSLLGSPVHDLSYTFYSGASKEALDNLEELLKIYHTTLSEHLKHYGLNAEKVYPFAVMKEEWRKYCSFGFIMGMLIWGAKNIEDGHVPDLNEVIDDKNKLQNYNIKIDHKNYDGPICNLIKHMCDNNFI